MCECGMGEETVEHYQMECPKYGGPRRALRNEVGIEKMNVARRYKTYQHTVKYIGETKPGAISDPPRSCTINFYLITLGHI